MAICISTYFQCFHQASSTRLITFLQNLFHELRRLHGFKAISMGSSRQVVTDWVLGGVRAFHPSNLVSFMSWHCARIFGSHFDFWTKICLHIKLVILSEMSLKKNPTFQPFNEQHDQQQIHYTHTQLQNSNSHWRLFKNPIFTEVIISWFHQILKFLRRFCLSKQNTSEDPRLWLIPVALQHPQLNKQNDGAE